MHPSHIGRYRIVRFLGRGGMGEVYEGHDDRLDRAVAIKIVRPEVLADPGAHDRFRREARAAARVSHPHICALYEFDEVNGQPFLVMELLTGESLAKRLERGPLPYGDVLKLADQMLGALAALHHSGVVHRDLKPANIFLTEHGAKLVDFGLAQPTAFDQETQLGLTGAGVVVGTPQYMPPERLSGNPADNKADVWAAAAVLHEAATGAPAFPGRTFAEVVHAIAYDEPKPIEGALLAASDAALREAFLRSLRGALMKDPMKRTASAAALAESVREMAAAGTTGATSLMSVSRSTSATPSLGTPAGTPSAPGVTRFVALPLRILRADPETDFLAFSIPDAVSAALSSLPGVLVRAPRALPAGGDMDARAIGRDWAVDAILAGTLMRAGSMVRISAQLIDAVDGTLRWSETAQAPLADLFGLQDELTSRIVSSLKLPLSGRDKLALARQAPANPEAYALVMRANQLMTNSVHWQEARGLYERAVELDPGYAPAWAGLGRARRMLVKWGQEGATLAQAQAAFARALALDPDLSLAHEQLAHVDVELGLAAEAMARLLDRAAERPPDARVMAGLVTACRYAGLVNASLAAHAKAVAIDPGIRTTVCWAHFLSGDYPAAIATDTGNPPFCALISQLILGTLDAAAVKVVEDQMPEGNLRTALRAYRHLAEGHLDPALDDLRHMNRVGFSDPEGWFLTALFFARINAREEAVEWLSNSVGAGYTPYRALVDQPHFDSVRDMPEFARILEQAKARVEHARRLYERAGGTKILGPVN